MTQWVLRHRGLTVGAWVLLAFLGAISMQSAAARMDYTYATPGQPGFVADQHIIRRFRIDPAWEPSLALLRLPPGVSMRTAAGQAMAARVFAAAPRAGIVAVADFASTGDPRFVLDGGRATWALINEPNPDTGPGVGLDDRLDPALRAVTPPGASVVLTGFEQMLSNAGPNGRNLLVATALGGSLALLVMILVYGSPIAVLPLVMAVPAVLVTFLGAWCLTWVAPVSYFLRFMITLLSLGIAIDYSLVVVIRWREERERGCDDRSAVLEACRRGGGAVLLSGLTVAVSLLSLMLLPVPFLRSVGFGGMLIPLVAVAVARTLLPVALVTVGPWLDRHRLWRGSTTYSRGWEAWARGIVRHPRVAALAGMAIVVVLSLPALGLNTAEPFVRSLSAKGPAAAAFQDIERNGVPAAVVYPIQILVHGGARGVEAARSVAAATRGVFAVLAPDTPAFRRGSDSLLTVIPAAESGTPEARATVVSLRARLAAIPGGAEVGGATAADMGFNDAVYGGFPRLLAFVAVTSLIVLVWTLRSVVLALKAVVLNTVSLAAAFGFMVAFWQWGLGSALIYGVTATGAIKYWIPVILFASLFGLSMDYEVFVLSRLREEFDRKGSTGDAVVAALAKTGRLVSCAAIILMVTFLSLSIDPNQIVAIFGSTLAVGVVVDALVIRTLLLPALVVLLGRWNWWLPARLARAIGCVETRLARLSSPA